MYMFLRQDLFGCGRRGLRFGKRFRSYKGYKQYCSYREGRNHYRNNIDKKTSELKSSRLSLKKKNIRFSQRTSPRYYV